MMRRRGGGGCTSAAEGVRFELLFWRHAVSYDSAHVRYFTPSVGWSNHTRSRI